MEFDYSLHACVAFHMVCQFLFHPKHVKVHDKSTALTDALIHHLALVPQGCAVAGQLSSQSG